MLYYQITMNTGSGTFAVAVDQNQPGEGSQLILTNAAANDPYQLWELSFLPNNGWNVGVALINKATGLMATFDSTNNGTSVILKSIPAKGAIANENAWQTNTIPGSTTRSIMPLMAENQCLNASGNSWGYQTPLIVWQWSGGQPNEVWSFTAVEA